MISLHSIPKETTSTFSGILDSSGLLWLKEGTICPTCKKTLTDDWELTSNSPEEYTDIFNHHICVRNTLRPDGVFDVYYCECEEGAHELTDRVLLHFYLGMEEYCTSCSLNRHPNIPVELL